MFYQVQETDVYKETKDVIQSPEGINTAERLQERAWKLRLRKFLEHLIQQYIRLAVAFPSEEHRVVLSLILSPIKTMKEDIKHLSFVWKSQRDKCFQL